MKTAVNSSIETDAIKINLNTLSLLGSTTQLMQLIGCFFLQKAVDENMSKMEFVVTDWNPAKNFYKKRGAIDYTAEEQFHLYQFDKASIEKMAST